MPHPPNEPSQPRHDVLRSVWRHRYVGARGQLVPGARGLLVLGLVLATLCGCRATGGGIPGIEPPKPGRSAPAAPAASPTAAAQPSIPAATAKSGHGQTTSQANTSLKKNSIYAVDLGAVQTTCTVKVRSPKPPLQDSKLAGYGKKLVGCLMKSFAKPLAAQRNRAQHSQGQGVPPHDQDAVRAVRPAGCAGVLLLGHPDHLLAGERVTTATRRTPSRGSVISGLSRTNSAITCRPTSGMLREYGQRYFAAKSRGQRYLLSRRLELQAQCFEGVFLATAARSIRSEQQ